MKKLSPDYKRIHLVAFDVPYPADYGGVIDIFYKLKALHKVGVDVILHLYNYGRKQNRTELEKYSLSVHYYTRRKFRNPFIGSKPYIVSSRNDELLLSNLSKDNAPIIFEGLHSTFHLTHPALSNRFKIVRTHNIEHTYYKHLEKSEIRYFKKYFFRIEAEKLRKYQNILKHADVVAAISPSDHQYFNEKFNNSIYIPAFHSNEKLSYVEKEGDYILYHGNLSVAENYKAAIELVKNVFSKLTIPVYIAGNNPPKELISCCDSYSNITLKTNLNTNQIHQLIQNAHINVLYTSQNTGIKLKLLNALYLGKFAIVNPLMIKGSGLENLCEVCSTFDDMVLKIKSFMLLEFTVEYFKNREAFLIQNFNNQKAIIDLIESIRFPSEIVDYKYTQKNNRTILRLSSFITQLIT